jgi:UDP-N-acetyl-2-amino-2-deoxyglucuronate dehydrogenase
VRVGIIGCGKIARSHVTALRGVAGVQVIAVVDVDIGRAHSFAAEHGIPHAYPDADQMLAAGLDAVTVCTPHGAHEAGVLAAARHRTHVLCEKPVALTVAQAHRMIAATAAAGVRFAGRSRTGASAHRSAAAWSRGSTATRATTRSRGAGDWTQRAAVSS